MPEYSLDQAADLAELALNASSTRADNECRRRNALYLALLSMELSLKAALEKAGMPVTEIRSMNHRLYDLHQAFVERCSFHYSLGDDESPLEKGRGAAIRDVAVTKDFHYLSVAHLMHATTWRSIATYPGELRYGEADKNRFPHQVVAQLAVQVEQWLRKRFDSLALDR